MNWWYFILGILVSQITMPLAKAINQAIIERRQQKFIKLVSIRFPDRKDITFISVDSSDKRGMKKLERQLREQFDNIQNDDLSLP